jgi:iron complex transport system ATP-binding protein
MAILDIRNLSAGYGNGFVVRGVSLNLEPGEFVAVIGRNCSGKSTLIRAAQGLLRHVEGRVSLDGADLLSLSRREIAGKIAYVPQLGEPVFEFTAGEIVRMGLFPRETRLQAFSARGAAAVEEAMRATETAALKDKKMIHLSGGERQRVIIARALVQDTPVLLLDEPSLHLDINYQVEIYGILKGLQTERRKAILAAEHNINLASAYAGRLVCLKSGSVAVQGTPKETVTAATIREIFGADVDVRTNARTGMPEISLIPEDTTP